MSNLSIGLISLAAMILLVYGGLHVPITLALSSFVGVWAIKGSPVLASKLLALAAADSISSYIFGVVPLFVLMGLVVSVADIGRDTFDVANQLLGRIKGGLGVATVMANAVFAAITGISIASAAVFTKVAVPEMLRHGYRPRFAVGVVAGSSVLGMLIPPSLLLILYGILSEQSVGDLFIAGIIPGLLLTAAFILAIVVMARRYPDYVGGHQLATQAGDASTSTLVLIVKILPIVILIGVVMGGIYGGVFTPTEAGAVGALGAIVLAVAKRRFSWAKLWQVAVETGHVTASILFLIVAASMYSRMLALSGMPNFFGDLINSSSLGLWGLIMIYVAIVLVMGTILDSSSIMLIMVPLVLPILGGYQVDLIWFGIVTVLAVEIGLLTPPLGIAVYVIKGTLDDQSISLNDIFAGALPFALIMLLVLALVIFFPWLATGLI